MDEKYTGWIKLPANERVSHSDIIKDIVHADCVLLGEQHNRADHHRWQLHVAAGLAAYRSICLGFEMFPARLNPVLSKWTSGQLSEAEFLEETDWKKVWGFPPELYMPLFRFCRDMAIPMVGLNCNRDLVRKVGAEGWENIPDEDREGISPACPSPLAYRKYIFDLTGGARPDREAQSADDPAFDRFVRAQEVWDRAFATHIKNAHQSPQSPLVIGIIGQGHLKYGGGVSWQLADLGVQNSKVLVTHKPEDNEEIAPEEADAVYCLPSDLESR